jgi:hypothetical protein
MTVSAPDLRRSNRLRWRRYANSDRTRLWAGRTSGHSSGLLVDRPQGQQGSEATTTRELTVLREWLLSEGCTHVAMESTGVYWKPIYTILEGALVVANAQHIEGARA